MRIFTRILTTLTYIQVPLRIYHTFIISTILICSKALSNNSIHQKNIFGMFYLLEKIMILTTLNLQKWNRRFSKKPFSPVCPWNSKYTWEFTESSNLRLFYNHFSFTCVVAIGRIRESTGRKNNYILNTRKPIC